MVSKGGGPPGGGDVRVISTKGSNSVRRMFRCLLAHPLKTGIRFLFGLFID